MRYDIGIIGAGIIGSALAFELARRNISGVHVFDPDLNGELSSTERNAGGVRHLWYQDINAELSRVSIQFFERIRSEIGFQQNGYLWLYNNDSAPLGKKALEAAKKRKLDYEELSVSQVRNVYPFLDKLEGVVFAIRGSKDGILNSNSLKNYLRQEAKRVGVIFHDRSFVTSICEKSTGITLAIKSQLQESDVEPLLAIQSPKVEPDRSITFSKVVICSGAWASSLLSMLGVPSVTRAVRRQIATFQAEGLDLSCFGMMVDTSGVYFHAEGGNILAGLVLDNEPEGFRFHYDNDFFETHIWPALYERSTQFERLKPTGGWGGLYSYTPDITGILGKVPGHPNLYESHSYTGHGVMHSVGAAIAMADLMTQGRFLSIDASQLSRNRFSAKKLLLELLHI